jgi:hypothetical protein
MPGDSGAIVGPVKDTINRLAGPFADHVYGLLAQLVRYPQSLRLFQKARAIADHAGIELKP